MKISRILITSAEITGSNILFSAKNSRYLKRVLRLKPGDEVFAFDGTDEYAVRLTEMGRGSVSGLILDSYATEAEEINITLAFGCVRPGPMQEIFRHCTELGVTRFVPLLTRRANRRPDEKKDRWESIVSAASSQSGRSTVPEVWVPMAFNDFLNALKPDLKLLMPSLMDTAAPIWSALGAGINKDFILLIGPEGGFETAEEAEALGKGFQPVSLGKGTLRSETAAILSVGAIMLNKEFENFTAIKHE